MRGQGSTRSRWLKFLRFTGNERARVTAENTMKKLRTEMAMRGSLNSDETSGNRPPPPSRSGRVSRLYERTNHGSYSRDRTTRNYPY